MVAQLYVPDVVSVVLASRQDPSVFFFPPFTKSQQVSEIMGLQSGSEYMWKLSFQDSLTAVNYQVNLV